MHQTGRKPKLLKDYAAPDYLIEEFWFADVRDIRPLALTGAS